MFLMASIPGMYDWRYLVTISFILFVSRSLFLAAVISADFLQEQLDSYTSTSYTGLTIPSGAQTTLTNDNLPSPITAAIVVRLLGR